MVALPPQNDAKKETFKNGRETFETLVQVYNIIIRSLKEIEDENPEKCGEWLKEPSFPMDNQQMVELLYFMQEIIDAAQEK